MTVGYFMKCLVFQLEPNFMISPVKLLDKGKFTKYKFILIESYRPRS